MPKVIMTKGLPGSGKSTWSDEQVKNGGGRIARINKDTLRLMMHAGEFRKGKTEGTTVKARNTLVRMLLQSGIDVIVDDTNLNPVHETGLRGIAKECNAGFEIKSFLDVPIATCIEQDLKRLNSVGEGVIRDQYDKWLAPKPNWVTNPEDFESFRTAVIVDIDGTVAWNDGHRGFYDYALVGNDKEHLPVTDLVKAILKSGRMVLFVSGRDDSCMTETLDWLTRVFGPQSEVKGVGGGIGVAHYWELHMRKTGDKRQDAVTKREIYDNEIEPHYTVLYAIDDRRQVVDLWRSLGIVTLDVRDGRF